MSTAKWQNIAGCKKFFIHSKYILFHFRFTDHWLVLVRSKVKPPKLRPKRRKRRRPDAPREESNITEDLSMLLKPLVASVDPMLIQHKYVLCILFQRNKEKLKETQTCMAYLPFIRSVGALACLDPNSTTPRDRRQSSRILVICGHEITYAQSQCPRS